MEGDCRVCLVDGDQNDADVRTISADVRLEVYTGINDGEIDGCPRSLTFAAVASKMRRASSELMFSSAFPLPCWILSAGSTGQSPNHAEQRASDRW